MTRVKLNILANFVGLSWSALMQLAFLPLYLKFLGIEAYGLIGFYITLQGVLQLLDFGLSPTMNREMARYSVMTEKAGEARDFVRTLEVVYWAIGILIGASICVIAPFIATHWIKASVIPSSIIQSTLMIMGVVAALQWPLTFYQGGLMGLQRQALLNAVRIGVATLSNGGAAFLLWQVAPTITVFFGWQIIVSAFQVSLTMFLLWRSLPTSDRAPRFDPALLRKVWRFAAGMSGITISTIILTQLDKVILSNLLSLRMFGYYTLAGVVGNGLYIFISPIFNALYPRFSALVVMNDQKTLKQLYHQGSQLMAALILPVVMVLSFFSFDIMLLWTGSVDTAQNAAPIVRVLVLGTALNGLMNLPYALQLANGWTSIGLYINIFLIITLVPAILFMATRYGAVGAAAVWVALNSIYLLIGVPLTHRRLLKGEMRRWFCKDIGLPFLIALCVACVSRCLVASPMSPMLTLVRLPIVLFVALAGSVFASSQLRVWLLAQLSKTR